MQQFITQAERNRISVVFAQIADQVTEIGARWAQLSRLEKLEQWAEYLEMKSAGEAVFHPFHRVISVMECVN